MKQGIHPEYRPVAFRDTSTGTVFIAHSTIKTKETIKHEGKEYPLYELEISSASHPFFTGTQKLVDTAGRIERFRKKYNIKE
ncbi:type B 50S ribosomal protein L31 [Spirochaetia bacterium 38H-sp]|uniref:Large ribosomal subunit protein bL31B n=1 Tax=Rarispira pelagica TaxID=3141764 RepID=A0ABU9UAB2_9SPIR